MENTSLRSLNYSVIFRGQLWSYFLISQNKIKILLGSHASERWGFGVTLYWMFSLKMRNTAKSPSEEEQFL